MYEMKSSQQIAVNACQAPVDGNLNLEEKKEIDSRKR